MLPTVGIFTHKVYSPSAVLLHSVFVTQPFMASWQDLQRQELP